MKILVCDVEGTIFKANYRINGTEYASTMWQPLAQQLGEAAIEEERATHDKWEQKLYGSYIEWVEDTISIHRKYGLKKDTFYSLINGAEYNDGVQDFFENLDRKKYIPVLVSGGFQELVRRAQKELNINYGYGACEYHFDAGDNTLAAHSLTPCDFDGKYDYIKTLFAVHKLRADKDWVFIGDGKNDVHIAKKAPISIGINTHPELEKVVDHVVNSFAQIPPLLCKENDVINLTTADMIDEPVKQSKKVKPDSRRELIMLDEFQQLKLENRKLRDQLNEVGQKIHTKEKRDHNQIAVHNHDYTDIPAIDLAELLDNYRVVFFGSRKERRLFQFLDAYHKNLTVISGVDNQYDTHPMENADFIFTFNKCMGHASSWKSDASKSKIPFANLSRDNKEQIERAMANILYRVYIAK